MRTYHLGYRFADQVRKLLKHWAQSWLLGVPVSYHISRTSISLIVQTVEVGFRDEEGILHTHKKFRTEDIPQMCVIRKIRVQSGPDT